MRNIIILGITSLLTDISSEMVYPLIPLYLVAQLGATPGIVGIIEGIAESLASFLKLYSGHISDKIGKRKPLAISGYSFSGIGKILIYFAGAWPMILLGRIADRLGKGIRTAPRDALIAESTHPRNMGKAFGLHRAMDTAGAAAGVIIAYIIITRYQGSIKPIFLWSLIPAGLGVITLFFVKETKSTIRPKARKFSFNFKSLPVRLKWFLIVVFIFALGNSSNQFLLLRAHDLGYDTPAVLLLYLLFNLVYSLFSFPAGRLSDKIGRQALLVFGYLFYSLVYFGFAFAGKSSALWLLFGFYGIYYAMTEGVEKALIADLCPSDKKATFMGLHSTLVGIGLLPASLLTGWLWTFFGPKAAFLTGACLGLSAAVFMGILLGGKPSDLEPCNQNTGN
ncbi:MAG: MFS transporter [Desulfobacterales bacterium]